MEDKLQLPLKGKNGIQFILAFLFPGQIISILFFYEHMSWDISSGRDICIRKKTNRLVSWACFGFRKREQQYYFKNWQSFVRLQNWQNWDPFFFHKILAFNYLTALSTERQLACFKGNCQVGLLILFCAVSLI